MPGPKAKSMESLGKFYICIKKLLLLVSVRVKGHFTFICKNLMPFHKSIWLNFTSHTWASKIPIHGTGIFLFFPVHWDWIFQNFRLIARYRPRGRSNFIPLCPQADLVSLSPLWNYRCQRVPEPGFPGWSSFSRGVQPKLFPFSAGPRKPILWPDSWPIVVARCSGTRDFWGGQINRLRGSFPLAWADPTS